MAKPFKVLLFLAIFLAFGFLLCSSSPVSQLCSTYKFSNGRLFSSCNDLPVLNSSLHWNYDQSSNMVHLAFRHSGVSDRRWIAWAINPTSAGMRGAQALVAFPRTDGTLVAYMSPITSYGTQLEAGNLSFPVFDLSATYENIEMVIFATIKLLGNSTTVNHLWQVGPLSKNTPMMHSIGTSSPNVKSMGTLDFLSGRITTATSSSTLKSVHGTLNTISWGILMPAGAIIARYLKVFKSANPLWFYMHVGCQLSACLLGVAGFGTGLSLGAKSPGIQHNVHRYVGIALFCLATAQVGVGFSRPHKDSKYRLYFNWFHYFVGYSTIILSLANIFQGFRILASGTFWMFVYIGIISFFGCVAALLEAYTWHMAKRQKSNSMEKNVSAGHGAGTEEV